MALIKLAKRYGRYGYRKIAALLRMEGWTVNHKKVERLWREEGLQLPKRHKKRRRLYHKDSSVIRLRPLHKNHIWSVDFVHDKLSSGRSYKMLTVLDEYTRQALCVEVRPRMGSADVLEALYPLLLKHGKPEYIRSDNGSEFIAATLQLWLRKVGIKPIQIYPGSPWENGVKLAGAGVFLCGVSLQIGEMIFQLRCACSCHSFDRRLNNNAAMKTALNRSA